MQNVTLVVTHKITNKFWISNVNVYICETKK